MVRMTGSFLKQLEQSPDGVFHTITRLNPNKVWLGGEITQVNDIEASESIVPGSLIERWISGTTIRFRNRTSVTGAVPPEFALDHPMANKGVDDAYAAGDLVEAGMGQPGAVFWAFIASGATVVAGGQLQPVSGGTLAAGTTNPIASSLESKFNGGPGNMRVRVETF